MKRYYFQNAMVNVNGHRLQVTSGGTVYEETEHGVIRRDALYLRKLRQLCVSLPEGQIRLKATRRGVKVVDKGLGLYT